MNHALSMALQHNIKKLIYQLKPTQNPIAMMLMIGKSGQGKQTLLQQYQATEITLDNMQTPISLFYDAQGIYIAIEDTLIREEGQKLAHLFKKINQIYPGIRISGVMLCIDIHDMLYVEPLELSRAVQTHAGIANQLGRLMNEVLPIAFCFTKLDTLAGFIEFYQHEHQTELKTAFGFSPDPVITDAKNTFRFHFDQFIQSIGQQVVKKLHPERSSVKRTLIREFPLQLAAARLGIQSLVMSISSRFFTLNTLYFTSAQQGDPSIDRLHEKIHREFALATISPLPQSINHKAYFVHGALESFQKQIAHMALHPGYQSQKIKWSIASVFGVALLSMGYLHFHTINALDAASKALLDYDNLAEHQQTTALYHLQAANTALQHVPSSKLTQSTLTQLKKRLTDTHQDKLQTEFIPTLLQTLESVISTNTTFIGERFQALKIYLLLEQQPTDNQQQQIRNWFTTYWQQHDTPETINKKQLLLHMVLQSHAITFKTNANVIQDARNFFNALPKGYLYYAMAKAQFPTESQPLSIPGFALGSSQIPIYFTKAGFQTVKSGLPAIVETLNRDRWVLQRPENEAVVSLIEEAYCYDYLQWWKNFIKNTKPVHTDSYKTAGELLQNMYQHQSFDQLTHLLQKNTSPNVDGNEEYFNQQIARHFIELSLVSNNSIKQFNHALKELYQLTNTLTVIHDDGKTAFRLTKTQFESHANSNPITQVASLASAFPEPLASWAQQVNGEVWSLIIHDSRAYINQHWMTTVYEPYEKMIAHHFPFDEKATQDVDLETFNHFFASEGTLHQFMAEFISPFLDMREAKWKPKQLNGYMLPINEETLESLMRANIITTMFFSNHASASNIEFTLQKIELDPVIASIDLSLGHRHLLSNAKDADDAMTFSWPENGAVLAMRLAAGQAYRITETGPWAFFKLLQKVNVLSDEQSNSLQILFEINGNTGRYLLTTNDPINPFTPGVLNSFQLERQLS